MQKQTPDTKGALSRLRAIERKSDQQAQGYEAQARHLHDSMLAQETRLRILLQELPPGEEREEAKQAYLSAVATRSLAQTLLGNALALTETK